MKLVNLTVTVGVLTLTAVSSFAQPKITKVPTAATRPESGKEMYTAYCAVCHGTLGKGDGPAAAALKKSPADLTKLTAQNAGKFPENRIATYIAGDETVAAHGSRDMPIWGELFKDLNRNESVTRLRIHNLSDYVKTLQAK